MNDRLFIPTHQGPTQGTQITVIADGKRLFLRTITTVEINDEVLRTTVGKLNSIMEQVDSAKQEYMTGSRIPNGTVAEHP